MTESPFLSVDTVGLDLRAVAARALLPAALMESAQARTWRDEALDHLCVELRTYVLTQHLDSHTETSTQRVEFDFPASWWQHYKRDVLTRWRLTRWFVRWRPVRTATEVKTATATLTWEQFATFPEPDVVVDPSLGRHLLHVVKSPASWRTGP